MDVWAPSEQTAERRSDVVRGCARRPDEICRSNMSGRVGGLVRTHWVSRWLLLRTRVQKPRNLPACVKAARDEGCVSAW